MAIAATLAFVPLSVFAQQAASADAGQEQQPTDAEVQALIARVIANQHQNDAKLDSYERIERQIQRDHSADGPIVSDKTYRVVPTGSGTLKLLFRDGGKTVSNSAYSKQLRDWRDVLQVAVHPDDPRQVTVLAKQKKRLAQRAKLIDTVLIAYKISWVDRETLGGRTVDKFALAPNPKYVNHGDSPDWVTHARATLWVDPEAAQVVQVDASIIRDISFGGGILGKVYKGGHFRMKQIPVGDGLWQPSFYEYDFTGRKFLFSFSLHEETTVTNYSLLGSPQKMLATAQQDLAHCCSLLGDP